MIIKSNNSKKLFACKYFAADKLLAGCDKEILGKKLKFGETEIEIKKSFYFESFITTWNYSQCEYLGIKPSCNIQKSIRGFLFY
ncbi:MAG: DUF424 family protein [Candidatus Aenigmarchaeota archaeon]|nr:DUF424 family protein [Candidatus Aenigmarchaeota archaeon]